MKQVNIYKNEIITNLAKFNDDTAMMDWVQARIDDNSWGLPNRWIKSINPEDGYLDQRETDEGVEYFYPAEYTIEIIDITEQNELEQQSILARKYLKETDWYIIRELDSGVQCPQEIKDARAAARLQVID